jgi:hypothetical protein
VAVKQAKTRIRKRDNAARRWLQLSKLARNNRLSEGELREASKNVATRVPSPPDVLVSRD